MVEESNDEEALKVISKSGLFPILKSLDETPQKFSELMFNTRLNPGVVDRHLKLLSEHGIIQRDDNIYSLSEKGRELLPALKKVIEVINS